MRRMLLIGLLTLGGPDFSLAAVPNIACPDLVADFEAANDALSARHLSLGNLFEDEQLRVVEKIYSLRLTSLTADELFSLARAISDCATEEQRRIGRPNNLSPPEMHNRYVAAGDMLGVAQTVRNVGGRQRELAAKKATQPRIQTAVRQYQTQIEQLQFPAQLLDQPIVAPLLALSGFTAGEARFYTLRQFIAVAYVGGRKLSAPDRRLPDGVGLAVKIPQRPSFSLYFRSDGGELFPMAVESGGEIEHVRTPADEAEMAKLLMIVLAPGWQKLKAASP